jgi:hypothetical protein
MEAKEKLRMNSSSELASRLADLIKIQNLDTDRAGDIAQAALDRPNKLGDEAFRSAFLDLVTVDVLRKLRSANSTNNLIEIIQSIDRDFFAKYTKDAQKSLRDTFRHLIIASKVQGFFEGSPKTATSIQFQKSNSIESSHNKAEANIPGFAIAESTAGQHKQTSVSGEPGIRHVFLVCSIMAFVGGLIIGLFNDENVLGFGGLVLLIGVPIYVIRRLKKVSNVILRVLLAVVASTMSFIIFPIGVAISKGISGST